MVRSCLVTELFSFIPRRTCKLFRACHRWCAKATRYQAMVTVRNASARAMKTRVQASFTGTAVAPQSLPAQELELAAGSSGQLSWDVQVPVSGSILDRQTLNWTLRVAETGSVMRRISCASSRKYHRQRPSRCARLPCYRSALKRRSVIFLCRCPPSRCRKRGVCGGRAGPLQPTLAGGLQNVRKWFNNYPYTLP